ncbi:RagB/SusD family nutrient uptake outer membrane protein [Mucilaginibacter sp. PAMB04274]|uniref:RagB/SusD family nutrient uptake outer membrane protein n=1 Tax=Mucilaginibacter sp. PAMB04274 TaxID=3138568 RepID=UPI0031F63C3A
MKLKRLTQYALLLILTAFASCKKTYLDTKPSDQVSEADALSTVANARVALNGIYRAMYMQYSDQEQDGFPALMIFSDFMGEDIVHSAAGTVYFRGGLRWTDHRSVSSDLNYFSYRFFYKIIANANMILSRIDDMDGVAAEKAAIKGEALALRGWAHYQSVQFFGKRYDATTVPNSQPGIPILLTNSLDAQPRSSVEDVYKQITTDLNAAITSLSSAGARAYKTHIDLNVAKGLRARVALTMQDWPNAAKYAAEARAGSSLMSAADYFSGFNNLANAEWMWGANQLADQLPTYGSFFAYMSANFNSAHTRPNPKLINSKLYALITATDIRKKLWWDGTTADAVNFPGVINASTGQPEPSQRKARYQHRKYLVKDPTVSVGDIPYMRTAEMYLIEAEANARAGLNDAAATALFPLAVARDPSYKKSTKTGQALIDEIMIQRRVELWGEGFRFLDLKRTNSPLDRSGTGATVALATVGITTPIPAGDVRWQFLIPRREIESNPSIEQNP